MASPRSKENPRDGPHALESDFCNKIDPKQTFRRGRDVVLPLVPNVIWFTNDVAKGRYCVIETAERFRRGLCSRWRENWDLYADEISHL